MTLARFSSTHAHRPVALWLLACCAMVALMIVLGGLTRLTHSGLSMAEWQPLSLLPPLNAADWNAAFSKYKETPEFRLLNTDMSLDGFKGIFWLEYIHRLWGRIIGVVFAVPLLAFIWLRRIPLRLAKRLAAIFVLGGLQGLMGWLMVKSGLQDAPDVSHYRLAAHLIFAFAILAALLWTALDLLPRHQSPASTRGITALTILVVLSIMATATWGGFVAGLNAGLIYNSFPLMGDRLIPIETFNLKPRIVNFFENPVAVQLAHRILAALTVLLASLLWLVGRNKTTGPLLHLLAAWVWVQAILGIATLLLGVPVALGSAHQMGAVILFGLAVALLHRQAGKLARTGQNTLT